MIRKLALELSKRMDKDQLAGLVVSLGLKFTDFHSVGKQERQNKYTYLYEDIVSVCFRLLETFLPCDPVRLIRIRVSECKPMAEIRLDRNLNEFAKKLTKEEA